MESASFSIKLSHSNSPVSVPHHSYHSTGITSSFLQRCWGPRCRPHACIASILTYGPSPFLNTGLTGVHYHTQLQDVFIFGLLGQFHGIALHAFSKSSCVSQFATHLHWSRYFKFICLFICLGSCVVQVGFEMAIQPKISLNLYLLNSYRHVQLHPVYVVLRWIKSTVHAKQALCKLGFIPALLLIFIFEKGSSYSSGWSETHYVAWDGSSWCSQGLGL